MFFYLNLILSTMTLAFLSQFAVGKLRISLCIMIALILGAFASVRGFVGTDTYSYHLQFDLIQEIDIFDETALLITEPAFLLLGKLVDLCGGDSFEYVTSIGVLQTLLIVLILTRLENPSYFLIFYIPTFYINFHYNILRQGTALLLMMLSLTWMKEGGIKFFLTLWASVFFHYSSFLFVPYILIFRQLKEERYIVFMLLIPLLVIGIYGALIFFKDFTDMRTKGYSEEEWALPSIGIGFFLQLLLYIGLCVCLFKQGKLEMIWFAIPVILIKIIVLRYPLVGRIEVFFQTSFLLLLTKETLKDWQGKFSSVIIMTISLLNAYGIATTLEAGDNLITDEAHSVSPYIPYHTMFEVNRF